MFVRDLLKDPKARDAADVAHQVVAVASSSAKSKADQFIASRGIPAPCAAYGSYEELVADANVDVIYVATPHSHHFQNAMLALEAGKNVLCEKAFTVNAAQTKILCQTAREKNLFLMEAVWTRYFPLSVQVRELIQKGEIGEVLRVVADTSFSDDVEERWGTKHRMVNPDLAGGCLLDCKCFHLHLEGGLCPSIYLAWPSHFCNRKWASTLSPGSSRLSITLFLETRGSRPRSLRRSRRTI